MTAIVAILLIVCVIAFEMFFLYDFMRDHDEIPTSMYYRKIARLQKEIERLTEQRKQLNPIKDGYFDKVQSIEYKIKLKKKEIKRVKVHIRIEDDAHKY